MRGAEMERLTDIINGWTFEETIKTAESLMEAEKNMFKWDVLRHLRDFAENYRERIKEYQQLEEKGRLLKLLCNRGDEVYFIKSAFSLAHFPIKAKITRICGVDCDNDVMYVSNTEYNGIDRRFKQSDIGKTVFLTKSAAEAKLKELWKEYGN